MKIKKWTEEEKDFLKKNYIHSSWDILQKNLSNRNKPAIIEKAKRLGLCNVRINQQHWTEEQLKILKENYHIKKPKEIAKLINRSYIAIRDKAEKLKLISYIL